MSDILREEQDKYLLIKEKLDKYRNGLDDSLYLAKQMSDPNMASIMVRAYSRQIYLYEKNKGQPYFAKIIFQGRDGPVVAYIGRIGFADLNDDDIIVDWRAPISELYYNSKLGQTQYMVENHPEKGELTLKRQIAFKNGEIISVYDIDNQLSSDEFLLPYLTGSADNRLKSIVSTIQEEQDQIIRIPINKNIIVQGVAGCGKTTVALHRLSYLIYNHREVYNAGEYYIISPNNVFKKYISTLLEDLDADQAQSSTVKQFVENIVTGYNILDKHEQYEYLTKHNKNTDYLKFKSSKSFRNILDGFVKEFEQTTFSRDLVVDGVKLLPGEEVLNVYYECNKISVEEKVEIWIDKLNHYLRTNAKIKENLKSFVENKQITLKKKFDIEHKLQQGLGKELKAYFNKNLDIMQLYCQFIKNCDKYSTDPLINELKTETLANLNKKTISEDDFGAILYLYSKLKCNKECEKICQVLIDEAQDLSYLQFLALRNIFKSATFSIFGDLAQSLYEYQVISSWDELADVFQNNLYIELRKSYRTTVEITANANEQLHNLGLSNAENVIRHGDEVVYKEITLSSIKNTIQNEIDAFIKRGYASAAVVCQNEDEVNKVKQLIDGEIKGVQNSAVMTVMEIKGLEFEGVILYNENSYDMSRLKQKQLYVAKTRALHSLVINRF